MGTHDFSTTVRLWCNYRMDPLVALKFLTFNDLPYHLMYNELAAETPSEGEEGIEGIDEADGFDDESEDKGYEDEFDDDDDYLDEL